ncbi:MAG: hypothetical protein EOO14_16715, partial [Chitinophagaceae bacterium]
MKKHSLLLLVIACLLFSFSLSAQSPQPNWWVANGTVNTIVQSGNTVYLGGDFNMLGPNAPNGTAVDGATGVPNLSFAKPNNFVRTAVPDGSGGWYIGGDFTEVGGQARNRLARINSDGTLHAWNPNAGSSVSAMAIAGSTVYVGGAFTSIGGQARFRLAAIDATTGTATAWNPNASGTVSAIAVSGSTVYAGGAFTTIGGQTRNRLAA